MKISRIKEAVAPLGMEITDETAGKLSQYYEMVVEKNKVMNLTAITEEEEFLAKHFVDSLSLAKVCDLTKKDCHVIDVGTGAGFPGLVLAICFPELDMTLFDSLQKRLTFLEEVITELGLNREHVRTLHGRAEDLGHDKKYRGSCDLVLARAVANLSTLSEYCIPLAKKGGQFIAYKTADAEKEAADSKKAITLLGGALTGVEKFTLPGTDYERAFIIIKKEKDTPAKYPRKAGTPQKEPL